MNGGYNTVMTTLHPYSTNVRVTPPLDVATNGLFNTTSREATNVPARTNNYNTPIYTNAANARVMNAAIATAKVKSNGPTSKAIICCFQYKYANDYDDLRKKNVITDLDKYIFFCNKKLGIGKQNIVILSDIDGLHTSYDNVIMVNSTAQFEVHLKSQLLLLANDGFLFFAFSGHGESLSKICHFVIPTGTGRSQFISGARVQQLLYYNLPPVCTCLIVLDTCYSGGLLSLKYKIGKNIQMNKDYIDMGPQRNIICFHSSGSKELSAVFYRSSESGSIFSHYLLLYILYIGTGTAAANTAVHVPHCLNYVTDQISKQVKGIQPIHHPFVQSSHPTLTMFEP